MKKIELIYFNHFNRLLNELIKIMDNIIELKEIVRWLNIWFDRKLSFKAHVKKRIASTNRIFYFISRLANIEKGLSFQVMRKLYITCVILIIDYGVLVW